MGGGINERIQTQPHLAEMDKYKVRQQGVDQVGSLLGEIRWAGFLGHGMAEIEIKVDLGNDQCTQKYPTCVISQSRVGFAKAT